MYLSTIPEQQRALFSLRKHEAVDVNITASTKFVLQLQNFKLLSLAIALQHLGKKRTREFHHKRATKSKLELELNPD